MSAGPKADDKAPDFTLPSDGEGRVSLKNLEGKKVVLYFYPKDDTPGCTKEAIGFTEALGDFDKAGAVVIGASKDSVDLHATFRAKHDLGITLVSDHQGQLCQDYGVWVEKSNDGRTYMGIERSTFLIDGTGVVRRVWRGVKVAGHVDEVLTATTAL